MLNESELQFKDYQLTSERLVESWSNMDGRKIRGFGKTKGGINFLEGINDDHAKANVAFLLENQLNTYQRMDETSRMTQVGSFEKYVFPIIRAVYANLVASELVTVQALTAPTGLVFYMDVLYGSNKGSIQKGGKAFDAKAGPSSSSNYTTEQISEEFVGSGTGSATRFTGTLEYVPVRPGTVVFTDGTQTVRDNGNGSLVGDVNAGGTNTISIPNGTFDFTFASAPASGASVTATYEYDMEANSELPELDFIFTTAPVVARVNKLRSKWSLEASQDLQAYNGLNLDVEITAFMSNMVSKEINYNIVNRLYNIASAGSVVWDSTPPDGVQLMLHYPTFYNTLVQARNLIFAATQREIGDCWVVCGLDVCNVIETLGINTINGVTFKPAGGLGKDVAGIHKIGTLGTFTIYKDPNMSAKRFLVGYKSNSWLQTGFIYAPYQGLFTTPTIMLDDLIGRKSMMQRVATKVINANYYVKGAIV